MLKKFKTAVVIGKFYPPHKGHKYLIDTALTQAEKVTVIVCDKKGQKIPGKLRAAWLKEIHPSAEVMVIDDVYGENDSAVWAKNTIRWLGHAPEAVFTSEDYGVRYAKLMGSVHVEVDKERKKIPVSGTLIRKNPGANLRYLEPAVRAHFIKRICVLGAESTGTTTMAKALAEHYKTAWVPEYGRTYWEGKLNIPEPGNWATREFIHIANEQLKMEDELARVANKVLICDTDDFATGIWHERYMNHRSAEVEKISHGKKYELYFLTDVDIPFVQDGTRDGEHIRHSMHKLFIKRLKENHKPFVILSGSREARLKKAIGYIDKVLAEKKSI